MAKRLMRRDATAYIRTDAREFTRETTIDVLKKVFPAKAMTVHRRPILGQTQTHLFGNFGERVGEVDLVLEPK
jgi:hypothetical protein